MWNSSRRIALTGTAVVLVSGGMLGLAWMANWLPIRFGDAPSGEVATEVNIDDIDWNSFEPGQEDPELASQKSPFDSETSPFADEMPPDDIFDGQSEPSFADNQRSTGEFASRSERSFTDTASPGSPSSRSGTIYQAEATSLPERFPTIEELRSGAPTSSAGKSGRVNLETKPHQVIQQAGFEETTPANPFAEKEIGTGTGESRLFNASEPETLNQARQFPSGVALADRGTAAPLLNDRNESEDAGSATAAQAGNVTEPASAATIPGTASTAGMELDLNQIDAWIKEGDYVSAHRDLSKIYWNDPSARKYIQKRLDGNAKLIYFSPQPHFLEPYVIQSGDYLQRIAPKYRISWQYLSNLNGINPRRIRAGQKLKVIKGPFAVFVDLSDFELTVHCHGFYVKRYDIGIGKDGASPVGRFSVLNKVEKPQWTDPNGRVVSGTDPTNPLGSHWIDIGEGFGIHGTIDPDSIGKAESRGCVRMKNSDVQEVYNFLINGSEVVIRP